MTKKLAGLVDPNGDKVTMYAGIVKALMAIGKTYDREGVIAEAMTSGLSVEDANKVADIVFS